MTFIPSLSLIFVRALSLPLPTGSYEAATQDPLPAPWQEHFNEQYHRPYYYNPMTKESVWERPKISPCREVDEYDQDLQPPALPPKPVPHSSAPPLPDRRPPKLPPHVLQGKVATLLATCIAWKGASTKDRMHKFASSSPHIPTLSHLHTPTFVSPQIHQESTHCALSVNKARLTSISVEI
jgi:hypothetical protein